MRLETSLDTGAKMSKILICTFLFGLELTSSLPLLENKISDEIFLRKSQRNRVPQPSGRGIFGKEYNKTAIRERINQWKPESGTNVWELSGLFEGDIMLSGNVERNGLLDTSMRWPEGIVPFMIGDDFDEDEEMMIMEGLAELMDKTCLIFRPYEEKDKDFIVVQGDSSGCWSFVGRHGEAQIINLHRPSCFKRGHGTVVHEFMHAVGFYHQQSSSDRDEFVTINWENILEGHEHNFKKYKNNTVTDYKVGYDYGSIMHYSSKAFSKNKTLETITPKEPGATIGQRLELSEKDAMKLQIMYSSECAKRDAEHRQ